MSQNTRDKRNARKKKGKKSKGSNWQDEDDDLLEEIVDSIDRNGSPSKSKYRTLAKELAAVLLPAISEVITDTIQKNSASKEDLEKCKVTTRLNRYDNDRLEQYTRRENVRIFNMPVDEHTQLMDAVVELLNDMASVDEEDEYRFSEKDIEVCHRVGKPPTKGHADLRPIIVRFESRKSVGKVYKYKKNLKDLAKYNPQDKKDKKVFIAEDLTQLRVRLRDYVKELDGVTKVYTRDGNIHCTKKEGQNEKHYIITNPDDLFALGIEPDFSALKLDSYQ